MRGFEISMPRRAKLRILAGVTAAVAIIAIVAMVVRNQRAYRLADLALLGFKSLPAPAQRIQDFHRVKVKNAKKVWELSAEEAQYFEESDEIIVIEPRVSFYPAGDSGDEQREVIVLRGGKGRLAMDGTNLKSVSLEGGIELRFRGFVVLTEQATFDHQAERVIAPGLVSITGDGVSLSGQDMAVEVSSERMRVHKVETVFSLRRRGER